MNYFIYDQTATDYLQKKDKTLGRAIALIGPIKRETTPDPFTAIVHSIVGQQISTKAQATVWARCQEAVAPGLAHMTPQAMVETPMESLRACGLSQRKVDYIYGLTNKVLAGEVPLDCLAKMSDEEIIKVLSALPGIGCWTAEMLLIFCLERPDVLSFNDLAIKRGMEILYRHKKVDRPLFEKYRRRYSPWCSVASLYLWAIAGGALDKIESDAINSTNENEPTPPIEEQNQ